MTIASRSSVRVLFVEDDPGDARLIRRMLAQSEGIGHVDLLHVDCLAAALAQLAEPSLSDHSPAGERRFDVILLDLSLPDSSGTATLARIQQAAPEIAVVVCTGFDDPDFALDAVHAGAQDYLVKGQGDGVLVSRALRYAIERKRLESELVEAKKIAEEANQRKSRFLAAMSHELRTPLNAILGFSEMIKGQVLGPCNQPKYVEYAQDIFTAGTHLLGLINDVLDLSKVEADRFQLLEEAIDLPALVGSCAEMMREAAQAKGLTLAVRVPGTLPALWADRRLVHQVVLNLLSNAVKFTLAGGRITLSGTADAEGLTLTVADTGVGIATDAIDRVMEEFQQADITIARDHGGTGLGLPLSRRFMALHGGRLSVQSAVGVGTTVTMRFPGYRLRER